MADQEFCELKVDLELRHSEIEREIRTLPEATAQLESIDSGKEFHEAVAEPAEAISADDIPQLVSLQQPFTLIETSLFGQYRSLPLIGRPDALHFDSKGSAWVVEYKVRSRPYLTPSDDAQLRLYGFLLKQDRRFDVRRLSLVCVVIARKAAEKIATLPKTRESALPNSSARRRHHRRSHVGAGTSIEFGVLVQAGCMRRYLPLTKQRHKASCNSSVVTGLERDSRCRRKSRRSARSAA